MADRDDEVAAVGAEEAVAVAPARGIRRNPARLTLKQAAMLEFRVRSAVRRRPSREALEGKETDEEDGDEDDIPF